jgi:hypothetical protein
MALRVKSSAEWGREGVCVVPAHKGTIAEAEPLGPELARIGDQPQRRGPALRSRPRPRDERDAHLFKVTGTALRRELPSLGRQRMRLRAPANDRWSETLGPASVHHDLNRVRLIP